MKRQGTSGYGTGVGRGWSFFVMALALMMSVMVSATLTGAAYAGEIDWEVDGSLAENAYSEVLRKSDHHAIDSARPSDNDELFDEYVERAIERSVSSDSEGQLLQTQYARDFEGPSARLFDSLKREVTSIAAGTATSTVVDLDTSDLFGKTMLSAQELGVGSFLKKDGSVDYDAMAIADERVMNELAVGEVCDRLTLDCPLELYWFDKAEGVYWDWSWGLAWDSAVGEVKATFALTVSFSISLDYAADEFEVSTDGIDRVNRAIQTASGVARRYANLDPLERIKAYRDDILGRATYDHFAADDSNGVPYGDPWQLISVFDGDNTTNVVCEGYSKAFKYLCDLSGKSDVSCITVSGLIGEPQSISCGESHMWNLVRMDDGKNYLCDLTNIELNEDIYPGSLFMGYGKGSPTGGYVFQCTYSYPVAYAYDSKTLSGFSSDELTVSSTAYEKQQGSLPDLSRDGWVTLASGAKGYAKGGSLVTGWLTLGDDKYWFAADGAAATGWKTVAGQRYYFREDGTYRMARGWATVAGVKYLFRADGRLGNGWVSWDGATYYADSGLPRSGWQVIGGTEYYFREDGTYRMASGWATIGGKKWLFRKDGRLADGWVTLDKASYYADAGVPRTGWQDIAGSGRRYFRPAPDYRMATGWATINGVSMQFDSLGNLIG